MQFKDIASKLHLGPSVVSRNYYKMCQNPDPYYKPPGQGRPAKMTPRKLHRAVRAIDNGSAVDATDVKWQLFPGISTRTVQERLSEAGLKGRVHRAVPYLKKQHRVLRLKWAEEHVTWTQQDWDRVWFSDESKFKLFGSDGRQWCRRRPGEEFLDRNVKQTVKHGGGNIQVWGCITPEGTGRLRRVQGRMNAVQYCDILTESLLGTLEDYSTSVSAIIYQQDNDSKHTSRRARAWFSDHGFTMASHPAQSPDMNPIKHTWDYVDRQLRKQYPRPSNVDELWAALQEEWAKLDVGYIRSLYESMPRRVEALLEAKGGHTRY